MANAMNNALISIEFEAKYDPAQDLVVGYANKAIIDHGGDHIPAEAWFTALTTFFQAGMPVKLLHRPKLIVGETVWLEIVSDGLKLASRPTIPEIRGMIEKGMLKGYSIGFFPVEESQRSDGVRVISKLRLAEVSYVDEPMNPGSYFGGKSMPLRSTVRIHFDAASGTLTALGLVPEEMALLAQMLGSSLEQAGIADLGGVKTLAFKIAEPEGTPNPVISEEGAAMKILRKIAEKLGIIAHDKVIEDMTTTVTTGSIAPTSATNPPAEVKTESPVVTTQPVPAPTPAPDMKALEARLAGVEKDIQNAPPALKALEERLIAQEKILARLIEVVSQLSPKATALATNGPDLAPKPTGWGLGWDPK